MTVNWLVLAWMQRAYKYWGFHGNTFRRGPVCFGHMVCQNRDRERQTDRQVRVIHVYPNRQTDSFQVVNNTKLVWNFFFHLCLLLILSLLWYLFFQSFSSVTHKSPGTNTHSIFCCLRLSCPIHQMTIQYMATCTVYPSDWVTLLYSNKTPGPGLEQ